MRFKGYLKEGFGKKKPDKKDLVLMYKVRSAFGLPENGMKFIDSEIIEGGTRKWWVVLIYHEKSKKYYGLNIDNDAFEDKNKKKALKWIKDEKFGDLDT